jgi:hypothetical protein
MWEGFIRGFCKVEFLCYAGDPNWLGWVVLGIPALILALIVLVSFLSFIGVLFSPFFNWLSKE